MPVKLDRRKGMFSETVAFQNDPKPWDTWLRRGCLCEATYHFYLSGYEVDGIDVLHKTAFSTVADNVINKGELVTYIGRLVRNGKYTSEYQFLCRRGIVIADPAAFKDAREDENGT